MAEFKLKKNPETGKVVFWEEGMSDWQEVEARRNPKTGEVAIFQQGASEWRNLGASPDASNAPMPKPDAAGFADQANALNFPSPQTAVPSAPAPQPKPQTAPHALPQPGPMPQVPYAAPQALPQLTELLGTLDTTDDVRAGRGFGRSAYVSQLIEAPQIPQAQGASAIPRTVTAPEASQTLGDLGKRTARGATEVVAAVPEALAIWRANTDAGVKSTAPDKVQEAARQAESFQEILEAGVDPMSGRRMSDADRELYTQRRDEAVQALQNWTDVSESGVMPASQRGTFKAGESVRQASQSLFGTPDPQFDDRFVSKLTEGAGSLAGFVGVTLLTGVTGGAVAGSASNTSGMYNRAKAEGATEEQARAAAYIGSIVGASEVVPIGKALDMLPSAARERVAKVLGKRLSNAFSTAAEEGVQEALVEIANNLTAKGIYNPEQGVFDGAGEAALIGAILGGGLGAVAPNGGEDTPQRRKGAPPPPPADPAKLEAPQEAMAPVAGGAPKVATRDLVETMMNPAAPRPEQPPTPEPEQPVSPPVDPEPPHPDQREAVPGQPQEAPVVGAEVAPVADQPDRLNPEYWEEMPGVKGSEDTGRNWMVHRETGEAIRKSEFERRLDEQNQPTSPEDKARAQSKRSEPIQDEVPVTEEAGSRQMRVSGNAGTNIDQIRSQRDEAGAQPELPLDESAASTPSMKSRWDSMSPDQRRDLLSQMEGTTTRNGELNKTAARVAGKAWGKITPGARTKLEERWGKLDEKRGNAVEPDNLEGNEQAARAQGREDFANGFERRLPPYIDPTDEVAGTAWYRGWDEANLAAPVEPSAEAKDKFGWDSLSDDQRQTAITTAGFVGSVERTDAWSDLSDDTRHELNNALEKRSANGDGPASEPDALTDDAEAIAQALLNLDDDYGNQILEAVKRVRDDKSGFLPQNIEVYRKRLEQKAEDDERPVDAKMLEERAKNQIARGRQDAKDRAKFPAKWALKDAGLITDPNYSDPGQINDQTYNGPSRLLGSPAVYASDESGKEHIFYKHEILKDRPAVEMAESVTGLKATPKPDWVRGFSMGDDAFYHHAVDLLSRGRSNQIIDDIDLMEGHFNSVASAVNFSVSYKDDATKKQSLPTLDAISVLEAYEMPRPTDAELETYLRNNASIGNTQQGKSVNLRGDPEMRAWAMIYMDEKGLYPFKGRFRKPTEAFEEWLKKKAEPAKIEGQSDTPNPFQNGNSSSETDEDADQATVKLGQRIAEMVGRGEPVKSNTDLSKLAAEFFGGTIGEGAFSPKDMYEGLELGINLTIQRMNREQNAYDPSNTSIAFSNKNEQTAFNIAKGLDEFLKQFPTQTRRDQETDAFQQFSTPPQYAFAVNWIANIQEGQRVLEPSAGNGGIAVFAQNAGAVVDVNELAKRRVPSLKALGFNSVTTENAEQIANIWAGENARQYDKIVMNPPFSASAGRTSTNTSATGGRHIQQALNLLRPGGRLVAIMGHTFARGNKRLDAFWKAIDRGEYTVQANVVVNGKNVYKKYGTGYDNRLIVIDKVSPTDGHETITGKADTIGQLVEMLEDVRNGADNSGNVTATDGVAAEHTSGEGSRKDDASDRDRDAEPERTSEPDNLGGEQDARDRTGGSSDTDGDGSRAEESSGGDARSGKRAQSDKGSGTGRGGRKSRSDSPGQSIELKDAEFSEVEEAGGGFAKYRPRRVRIQGAKEHPMLLVESSAMATVDPPKPNYDLKLPAKMVEDGLLSEAQLEQVVYAGAAHSEMLPTLPDQPAYRKGYYIGDGTGVGKTREIAGIIADNWAQGRKKHILVSKDKKLLKGARRDFDNVGMNKVGIQDLGKTKSDGKVEGSQGVLFATYSTIGKNAVGKKSRLDQIVEWVGKDFDGTLIFDEAHLAGNALPVKGKRGTSKPSQTALAVIDLQQQLPNARVVYASATAATEVYNLAYAERLGLWGLGTPFPNALSFVTQIDAGGIAAMEVVARDMKQMGVYMARGLSFEGVEYAKVEHELSPDQMAMYDAAASSWQKILSNVTEVIADHTEGGGRQRASAMAQFWSSHQRFFNQVLTSMQMPTAIEAMKSDLAAGMAPVVQIVNTNEAATNRAIAKLDTDQTLDDIDITPRDMIIQFLENSFPIHQFEEVEDDTGTVRTQPVKDAKGNYVVNAEAVRLRDELVNEMASMQLPGNPLDLLIETFGADKVAEVTGRSSRIVTKKGKKVTERRSQSKALAEAGEFQGGKRDVLVFSDAGGTGMDFHADKGVKNNKRRAHYILQAGWRADRAIQGFGRTHRTNQTQPPIYKLAGTNLSGHKRFTSSIARRLDQLGALTKGQKDAGGGMFDATDNLENEFAGAALQSLFYEIARGDFDGFSIDQVESQLGLNVVGEKGFNQSKIPEVPQFLNRLLNTNIASQNLLFDRFMEHMNNAVQYAIENGQFTAGVEEVKHDGAVLNETKEAFRDPKTGATSEYRMVTLTRQVIPVKFADVNARFANVTWKRHRDTGVVYGFRTASSRTNEKGNVVPTYHRHSVTDRETIDSTNYRFDYDIIQEEEAEFAWNEQIAEAPATREETLHMVTGALLPIWDRLPSSSPKIVRLKLDDGRSLLGREIPDIELTSTLENLGLEGPNIQMTGAQMQAAVMEGKTVLLSSGHKLERRKVGGEQRVEITSTPASSYTDFQPYKGVFSKVGFDIERIQYKNRAFVPSSEKGTESLDAFMQGKNIVNVTTTKERRPGKVSDRLGKTASHTALRAELDRLGLKDVELRFDPSIDSEGRVDIDFLGNAAITIGSTTNPRWTLGHEALHVFRHMGAFDSDQWMALARQAERAWLEDYQIEARYPDLTRAEQIEEAVAEAYGGWLSAPETSGPFANAFQRIRKIVEALVRWVTRQKLQSPEAVFAAIAMGHSPKQLEPVFRERRSLSKVKGGLHLPDRRVWDSFMGANGNVLARVKAARSALGDTVDRVRVKVQDRVLPLRRAQEAIERKYNRNLPDEINAYLAEELYSGRAGAKLDYIDNEYTTKIIDIIGANKGMSVESVGEYLYARHAEERNRRIAEINEDFPDGGSGMSTDIARNILAAIDESSLADAYEGIGQLIDQLRDWGINERYRMGLMNQMEADAWRKAYDFYVPLKGWAETDFADGELDVTGIGRGYNVRGDESKMAMGRTSEAANPLIAALTQAQELVIRGEKNRVGQHLFRLAKDVPAKDMWEIKKSETRRVFNEATGLVETRTMSPISIIQSPNELAVKVDGEEHRVVLNDSRLARSVTQIGTERMPEVLRFLGIYRTFFSAINTMLDPEFVIRNFARDTVTANINIRSKEKAGAIQKGMMRDLPKALIGAYRGLSGKSDTEWAKHFRAFSEAGGKVSFWTIENPEASGQRLERRIARETTGWQGKALGAVTPSIQLNPILSGIERANLAVDNAIRLAAFVHARKAGYSAEQAASLSKNLTVNFNRRGEWGDVINAAYVFSNAALQGTHILLKAMKYKAVRKIVYGLIALGFILDVANAYLSEEDEDGELAYDKIPNWKSQTNLVFMSGDNAATIWLPYGYNVFPYLGQQLGKVTRGVKDPGEALGDVFGATFSAFSPISGNDLHSTVTPTILQPINQLRMNEDWLGRPIRPESAFNDYGPDAYKYFASVSDASRFTSDFLNRISGGNQAEAGFLDVSPEYLDHSYKQLSGGVGRFIGNSIDIGGKLATKRSSEIDERSIPFYRSLKYDTGHWLDRDRYYRFRNQINEAKYSAQVYAGLGQEVPDRIARMASLDSALRKAERNLSDGRKSTRAVRESDFEPLEKLRRLDNIRKSQHGTMLNFNKTYVRIMGPQGE